MMPRGFGDITPLNIPAGAFDPLTADQQSGWVMGADGNWYWSSGNNTPPNLSIPVTKGPGVPSNAGWVTGPGAPAGLGPDNNWYWTGPGTRPTVLPGCLTPPGTMPSTPLPATGLPFNWTPQPIIPNSMLPDPLNRTNPLVQPAQFIPNRYDFAVISHARRWEWVANHGGLKSCCRIPELGAPIYDLPPWEKMPSNGYEYNQMAGLPVSAISSAPIFDGTDTLILEFQVPSGYDGVINRFVAQTQGVTGFDDFSGNIVWRLQYGIRFAKNFGNVTNTFGSFSNALQVPQVNIIRLISGQTVKVFASIPVGSPVAGGTVSAGVFGWFYPRR
jgi:hypothetical protein